jgi:dethiobiotin synthetase
MKKTFFVTGSGTGVGKTFVMRALLGRLRRQERLVEALKPVVSGFDESAVEASDTGRILAALGHPLNEEGVAHVSPWRFAAPLSPDMAAAREGRRIYFDRVVDYCRERSEVEGDVLLIEGIGGVMVPLDDRNTVLDWIAALRVPALLVTGSYLGTLSHTLTAVAALQGRGVEASVIVSESEESPVHLTETVATLRRHLPGRKIAGFPRTSAADPSLTAYAGRLVTEILGEHAG